MATMRSFVRFFDFNTLLSAGSTLIPSRLQCDCDHGMHGCVSPRCPSIGGGVMRAIALVATLLALAYLFYAAVSMLGQALVFS